MAQDKPTLCWKCAHACGGCSWSDSFTPVEGWTAKPTIIHQDKGDGCNRDMESFIVIKCPLFENDTDNYHPDKRISYPNEPKAPSNPTNKSPLRRALESLPKPELLCRIAVLDKYKDIALMALIDGLTIPQIGYRLGICNDTVRKRLFVAMRQIAEVVA